MELENSLFHHEQQSTYWQTAANHFSETNDVGILHS
jgi:hypothetical protein